MTSVLDRTIEERFETLGRLVPLSIRVPLSDVAVPYSERDIFSNDYLSLTTNSQLRCQFLAQLVSQNIPLGSTGSRLFTGNTARPLDFEARMKKFFGGAAALVCNSGYEANNAFFSAVPEKLDVTIYDSLSTHQSWMELPPPLPARMFILSSITT
jgi:7-keto-8-aminopelargonate synthetase-like enzyme